MNINFVNRTPENLADEHHLPLTQLIRQCYCGFVVSFSWSYLNLHSGNKPYVSIAILGHKSSHSGAGGIFRQAVL